MQKLKLIQIITWYFATGLVLILHQNLDVFDDFYIKVKIILSKSKLTKEKIFIMVLGRRTRWELNLKVYVGKMILIKTETIHYSHKTEDIIYSVKKYAKLSIITKTLFESLKINPLIVYF